MPEQFRCPSCHHDVLVEDQYFGGTVYCTKCGDAMSIPTAAEQGASHAAAPTMPPAVPHAGNVRYAGFWIRVLADILDSLVVLTPRSSSI